MGWQPPSSPFSGLSLMDYHLSCCLIKTTTFHCCPLDQKLFFHLWRKHSMSRMASFGISKTFSMMHFLIFVTAFTMTLKQCPQSIRSHFIKQSNTPACNADWCLDGTLEVLDTIVTRHLKFTAEDSQKHVILICAGDQLSKLINKVSLSLMHNASKESYLWSGSCSMSRRLRPPWEHELIDS